MDYFTFLKSYQEIYNKLVFERIVDLRFSQISFSQKARNCLWNYSVVNPKVRAGELKIIESKFDELGRKKSFLIPQIEEYARFRALLKAEGYELKDASKVLFYKNRDFLTSAKEAEFKKARIVESENEVEIFFDVLDRAYSNNPTIDSMKKGLVEKGNFFGEHPGQKFISVMKDAWKNDNPDGKLEYFLAFDGQGPVAIASLISANGLGYINCVGSLHSVRGRGFGRLMVDFSIKRSMERDNQTHFLFVLPDSYPYYLYKKMGFSEQFSVGFYAKM